MLHLRLTKAPFAIATLLVFFGCSSTQEQNQETALELVGDGEAINNASSTDTDESAPSQSGTVVANAFDNDWNDATETQHQQQAVANTDTNAAEPAQQANAYQENYGDYEITNDYNAANSYESQYASQYEPPLNAAVPEYQAANTSMAANLPEPEPMPAELPPIPPTMAVIPDAGTPLIKGEVLPEMSQLYWVGYDFEENDRFVRIEMVTRGNPKFNVFQERNQSNQPELVIRFFDTTRRAQLARDIDASEFRSPVAFVRTREDLAQQHVDVILTMRDAVRPRLYAEHGNVMMTFAVPDYYLGNPTVGDAPIAQAEVLADATIMPDVEPGSDIPEGLKVAQAYVPNPTAEAFTEVPTDGGEGLDTSALPVPPAPSATSDVLPANFNNYAGNSYGGNVATNAYGSYEATTPAPLPSGSDYSVGSDVTIDTGAGDAYQYGEGGYEYNYQYENDASGEEAGDYEYDEELNDDALDDYEYDYEEDSLDKFEVRERAYFYMHVAQDAPDYGGNYSDYGVDAQASGDPLDATLGTGTDFQTDSYGATEGGNIFGAETGDYGSPVPAAANTYGTDTYGNTATNYTTATPVDYGGYNAADYGSDLVGTETAVPTAPDQGRRVELDFENAPLSAVIKTLSEESGINFVGSADATKRNVTIKMSGIPFNEALRAILDANGLGLVEIGQNLIRIDTLEAIAEAETRKLEAERAKRLREPTQILVHRLSYARAKDISETVAAMAKGLASGDERVSVEVDPRTNSLIVNAPATAQGTIKALLERVDLETPQVKIASRIVEVRSGKGDVFGVTWGGPVNYDQSRGLGFGSLPFPNNMRANYSIDAGGNVTDQRTGLFNFTFGSIADVTSLDLALSMNENLQNIEILQTTDLIVEDNTAAEITAGGTDYFQPPSGSGVVVSSGESSGQNNGFNEVDYNLTVSVTPRVTADGRVQMALDIESITAAPPPSDTVAASSDNRSIKTSLLRRSGETAVIGGVYNTRRDKTVNGIPGLSSLPLIGALFRSSSENEAKRELMILVTPTILGNGVATSSAASVPSIGNYGNSSLGGGNYNYGSNYNYNTNGAADGGNTYGVSDSYNYQSGNSNYGSNAYSTDSVEGQQYSQNAYGNGALNGENATQGEENAYGQGNYGYDDYDNVQSGGNYQGEY